MSRRIAPSRFAPALAVAPALMLFPGHAQAAAKPRAGVYRLAMPAAGHVTVAAVEVKALKHGRGRPPTRLTLSLPGRYSLPDSVRIFYARRRLTGLRYELLLVAINRATGRRFQASAASTQVNAGNIVLTFPSLTSSGHTCGTCAEQLPRTTTCKSCWFKKAATRQFQLVNADTADAAGLGSLVPRLRGLWTNNGDTNSVFGNAAAGALRDPTVGAGYYDNHRAFAWDKASLADPAPLLRTVVDDLLTGQAARLIPDLELIGQADLNANGKLDSAATPDGGAGA